MSKIYNRKILYNFIRFKKKELRSKAKAYRTRLFYLLKSIKNENGK